MNSENLSNRIFELDKELDEWQAKMQEIIDYYGLEYPAQVDSKTLSDLSCLFSVRVQDLKTAINSFRFPELYSSQRRVADSWAQHLG